MKVFRKPIGHPVSTRTGKVLPTSPDPATVPNGLRFHPPKESPGGHVPAPHAALNESGVVVNVAPAATANDGFGLLSRPTPIMPSQITGTEATSTMTKKDWING